MDAYERIDALLFNKHLSRRKLARLANIPETTLASVFARRPKEFPLKYLKPIAKILGVPWEELAGYRLIEGTTIDGKRINLGYERPDLDKQLETHAIAGDENNMSIADDKIKARMYQVYGIKSEANANLGLEPLEYFKVCVLEMLEYLNFEGVMTVLTYTGALAQDEKYRLKK